MSVNEIFDVAASHRRINVVKLLLKRAHQLDINAPCYGSTFLESAARSGHLDIVSLLLEDPRLVVHASGTSELHEAVHTDGVYPYRTTKSADVLKRLASDGRFDIEARNAESRTVLHQAVHNGFLEAVQYLLGTGSVDVNSQDGNGRYILHSACHFPWHIVDLLLRSPGIQVRE